MQGTPTVGPTTRGVARGISEIFAGSAFASTRVGAPAADWDSLPECVAAGAIRGRGGSDADVLLLLTFTAAMDRARDAERLWRNAASLHFAEPWAFDPAAVAGRPLRDLVDALRTSGVSQRHGPDGAAWRLIAESLLDTSAPAAIRRAVFEGEGDAVELRAALDARTAAGTALFPFLRGPKVGPMWVRMLVYPGAATIRRMQVIPIAVDVQVRKVTEYLGITDTGGEDLEAVRHQIEEAWSREVAASAPIGPPGLDGTAAALDPVLWFYARWGCTHCEAVGRRVPVAAPCGTCRFPARDDQNETDTTAVIAE